MLYTLQKITHASISLMEKNISHHTKEKTMMKSIVYTLASGLLLSLGSSSSSAKSSPVKIPGIANTSWACNYTEVTSGFETAGNVFFGDGIYCCDMDINNQRPFPGFPEGAHATVLTGTWKALDACHIKIVASAVALSLQPDPQNPSTRTWQPFARIKDIADMKVKGDTLKGRRTVSFYEYSDITLTKKLPIPDLVQDVICKKVTA